MTNNTATQERIIERDGALTISTNRHNRCIARVGGQWVGGVYDPVRGQFSDGRNSARGISAAALAGTYTHQFTSKKAALDWLS